MSRGVQLSADTPVNLSTAFGLQIHQVYTLQLQDGTEARLFESTEKTTAPDIDAVDSEDAGTVGEVEDRPMRLGNGETVEYTARDTQPRRYLWAWDEGEGRIAVIETI